MDVIYQYFYQYSYPEYSGLFNQLTYTYYPQINLKIIHYILLLL